MCDPVSATLAVAAVASVGMSYYQGQKQANAAKDARRDAEVNAKNTADQADQAFNAQNKKTPNVAGAMDANTNAAKGGIGSTMLTGAQGIDPTALNLSQNNLLGA